MDYQTISIPVTAKFWSRCAGARVFCEASFQAEAEVIIDGDDIEIDEWFVDKDEIQLVIADSPDYEKTGYYTAKLIRTRDDEWQDVADYLESHAAAWVAMDNPGVREWVTEKLAE